MTEPSITEPSASPTLLFVDDEASILSSLRRLFRPQGYRILTAESGAQGLQVLEQEAVDLVISDMRMPEMDGAKFLEQVRSRWPRVIRILLTGYADIGSTIAAINRGEIYRYISKPWDDNEIQLTVREALERQRLEAENVRLNELTRQQNEELKALNASLEQKVAERTAQLRETLASLDEAHKELKKGFMGTVRIFSSLIELRGGKLGGHSRRVAEHARDIAHRLDLPETEQQDVLVAALLHDIGKISLPDNLLERPFNTLGPDAKAEVMRHPAKGQQLLMGVSQLATVGKFIRHHHECLDGSGYPDKLGGLAIPMGARILAVANDFDALQMGTLTIQPLTAEQALEFIIKNRGHRYDPRVVDAFKAILTEKVASVVTEVAVRVPELKPGMVLARDLVHREGYLLLPRGTTVTEEAVEQLASVEEADGHPLTVIIEQRRDAPFVLRDKVPEPPPRRYKAVAMSATRLKEGMVLSSDLMHKDGYLLLSRGYRLDETIIKQLREIEVIAGQPLTVYIRMEER